MRDKKTRFWNAVLGEDFCRVVKIKSLMPYIADGMIWWPSLLVDDRAKQRSTTEPGWNQVRIKAIFGINK